MRYRITTRTDALALLNNAYDDCERLVAAQCGAGKRFEGVTDPTHVQDVCAMLVVHDPGLLTVVADLIGADNEAEALDTVEGALMGLFVIDRDLFARPTTDLRELWRLTIKTNGAEPPANPEPKSDYAGKVGRRDESELWFWIRDRMDWPTRRRWQYDLRKQAAAKAKAKRAKKADAHE